MTFEIALVLIILAASVVLFAMEKFSVDLVALMVLGVLLGTGLVNPEEGVSGFSNQAVITVAAMFILSAGLQKTGAVREVGEVIIRFGQKPLALLILVMIPIGLVSAFINNTAAVAVFIPLVLGAAHSNKVSPSKLLIPLSFASQFGGVCTLIGTSTNLLVSSISANHGYGAFRMFEFSRLGLIMFAVGIVYFLFVGRFLLPARKGEQLTEVYQLGEYIAELRVLQDSALIGKTLQEIELGEQHDVTVLELLRDQQKIWSPWSEPLAAGDVLLVKGKVKNLMDLRDAQQLEIHSDREISDELLERNDLALVEALLVAGSLLVGRTLSEVNFRRNYNCVVLALQRHGEPVREKLATMKLRFGDALLLLGPKEEIDRMRREESLVVLEEVQEPRLRRNKAPWAIGIIVAVILSASIGLLPIMVAALLGCLAMTLTRCLRLEEAYAAVDWHIIVLLAGILPLGIAMEETGAAKLLAESCLAVVEGYGPVAVLAVVYFLTAVLTAMISNNATAVLLAPLAISAAIQMDVDPKPFLMAVTFAASTSFATPIGYQTNAMVYNAGGYRFFDFMKVGLPLNLLFWIASVYFIPKFWPF